MGRGGAVIAGLVLAVASMVGSEPAGAMGQAATTTSVSPPSSMAAIGDSFTFGFATGAPTCNAFVVCPEYSWSTGTAVNSHYQRLVTLNPAMTGNATNAAVLGAPMSSFVAQAGVAGAAQPDYVTVLLGGGDICFGSTTTAQFAAQFRAGMDELAAASPNSRVLVASIWNFESMRTAVLSGNPSATFPFCGSFFNASTASRAVIMDRVVDYNQALAAECGTYANCRFDGNALFNHVWASNELSPVDNFHPSVAGQEMISAVLFAAGYQWGTPGVQHRADCEHGGWATVTDSQGRPFRNQGDCVSYVATGGGNGAGG